MTIGEVEEFLWSLSTTLEGEIGNWRIRFCGVTVSVNVEPHADRLTIDAPIAFTSAPGLSGDRSPVEGRYRNDGTETRAVFVSRLSELTMNRLQAGFQQVVDRAGQKPETSS